MIRCKQYTTFPLKWIDIISMGTPTLKKQLLVNHLFTTRAVFEIFSKGKLAIILFPKLKFRQKKKKKEFGIECLHTCRDLLDTKQHPVVLLLQSFPQLLFSFYVLWSCVFDSEL